MRILICVVCAFLATVRSASAGDATWRPLTRTASSFPAASSHHATTAEVEIEWTCARPRPGLLRLRGVARNSGEREVRFLELGLVGVDAKDEKTLKAAAGLPDIVLSTSQASPFEMDLRTVGTEVRFDLSYQYRVVPRLGSPRQSPSETRNTVRDACAEAAAGSRS